MFFIDKFEKKYKSIDDIPEIQRRVEPDNVKKYTNSKKNITIKRVNIV